MESYYGCTHTPHDHLTLFELARSNHIPRLRARLSDAQKESVRAGNVYMFSMRESRIRRWTDNLSWTPSRTCNEYIFYQQIGNTNDPLLKKIVSAEVCGDRWQMVCYTTVSDEITRRCCEKYEPVRHVPVDECIVIRRTIRENRNTLKDYLIRNCVHYNMRKIYNFVDETNSFDRLPKTCNGKEYSCWHNDADEYFNNENMGNRYLTSENMNVEHAGLPSTAIDTISSMFSNNYTANEYNIADSYGHIIGNATEKDTSETVGGSLAKKKSKHKLLPGKNSLFNDKHKCKCVGDLHYFCRFKDNQ